MDKQKCFNHGACRHQWSGFSALSRRRVFEKLERAGVSTLSVSLNAHNKSTYTEVCRPKFENAFEKVLEFIERARDECLDVEVTAVTIPEIEISKVEKIASDMKVRFRVRPYLPCVW